MEILIAKTFHHPKVCWVCSKERLRKGTWTYCESCEEYHFICESCIPNYTENKIPMVMDTR